MRGGLIALILLGVLILVAMIGCSKRNGFIEMEGTVKQKAADMDVQYQRRADLVDQMVKTVKGQMNFEQQTLTDVIRARASATQMRISPENLDPESLKRYQAAQGELSQALGRFLSIAENYPELRTNQAFSELRTAIEGTENRIQFARNEYNAAVKQFNVAIKKIPWFIFAWGFSDYPSFTAEPGAEKRPDIDFGNERADTTK